MYTNKEIVDYVFNTIQEESNAVSLPQSVGYGFAYAMQQIPGPWMTLDGLRRQSVDLVMPQGAMGFDEFGMADLTTMEEVAERYLIRFRKVSMFVDDDAVVNPPR